MFCFVLSLSFPNSRLVYSNNAHYYPIVCDLISLCLVHRIFTFSCISFAYNWKIYLWFLVEYLRGIAGYSIVHCSRYSYRRANVCETQACFTETRKEKSKNQIQTIAKCCLFCRSFLLIRSLLCNIIIREPFNSDRKKKHFFVLTVHLFRKRFIDNNSIHTSRPCTDIATTDVTKTATMAKITGEKLDEHEKRQQYLQTRKITEQNRIQAESKYMEQISFVSALRSRRIQEKESEILLLIRCVLEHCSAFFRSPSSSSDYFFCKILFIILLTIFWVGTK